MSSHASTAADRARGVLRSYLCLFLALAALLGVLHVCCSDLSRGGVRWFDLDKERNLATWFTGGLFFLLGISALVAYHWETKRNGEGEPCFRLPGLWLGLGVVGMLMSLDEITILHENLFWIPIRQLSDSLGGGWVYVTQWQLTYAPAMLAALVYFVLFFSNRFAASDSARRAAFGALGCWVTALFLEGIRHGLKLTGEQAYAVSVLVEEEAEMVGALLLVSAVASYTLGVALDFTEERRAQLRRGSRFLTRRSVVALAMLTVIGGILATGVAFCGKRLADMDAPVPSLIERMRRNTGRSEMSLQQPRLP